MHERCWFCSYIESDKKNMGCIGCVSVLENDALEGECGNWCICERSKEGIGIVVNPGTSSQINTSLHTLRGIHSTNSDEYNPLIHVEFFHNDAITHSLTLHNGR